MSWISGLGLDGDKIEGAIKYGVWKSKAPISRNAEVIGVVVSKRKTSALQAAYRTANGVTWRRWRT